MILRETDQSHSSKGINAMTAANDIDWPQLLAERLTTTHPDVLRELLAMFIHTLPGAEADAVCGCELRSAQHRAHQSAQRLSASPIRHPGQRFGFGDNATSSSQPDSHPTPGLKSLCRH